MTLSLWLTFLIAAILIAITPGSGAILSMSHGLAYGVRKTTASILGLQLGLIFLLTVAGAGVGSLLLASEMAFNIVKTIGAFYLIYLGISQWRAKVVLAPEMQAQAAYSMVPSFQKRFLHGLLTNVTNPKGVIFMVAVLPQFIVKDTPLLPQLLILGLTICVIDIIVMHGYALAASSMQRFFRNTHAVKKQNRFFGSLFIAIGTGLFFVKRGPVT